MNLCESRGYEELLRQGEKVLTGSPDVEKAVDVVESALDIYDGIIYVNSKTRHFH